MTIGGGCHDGCRTRRHSGHRDEGIRVANQSMRVANEGKQEESAHFVMTESPERPKTVGGWAAAAAAHARLCERVGGEKRPRKVLDDNGILPTVLASGRGYAHDTRHRASVGSTMAVCEAVGHFGSERQRSPVPVLCVAFPVRHLNT